MVDSDSKSQKNTNWISKVKDEIHRLKRDSLHGGEDAAVIRLQLFLFFRMAYDRGILSSLNPESKKFDPMFDELEAFVQKEVRNKDFQKSRFQVFAQSNYREVDIAKSLCDPIYQSIRLTRKYKKSRRLRAVYFEVFGSEEHFKPHLLRRMKRPARDLPTGDTTKILRDYILFRADRDNVVRPAFFRFYEHETLYIRSMGLRLDDDYGRISSKGWMVSQQYGHLVSGYIIDRTDPNGQVKVSGGYSNLWINDEQDSPLYQETDGLISMTTVYHFQASYGQLPTSANGVLIRLKGLEKQGGQQAQLQRNRNKATYDLQTSLIQRFQDQMTVPKCCELLASRSGIDADLFVYVLTEGSAIPELLKKPETLDPLPDIYIDGNNPFSE